MAGFDGFHPAIDAWFARRFAEGPTPAQERGWPLIAAGQHTLIAAPTGSGKTLAAFLVGIDQLLREACEGSLPDETRVIYVSPLKALAVDVAKNLVEPLAEMHALAAEQGRALPEIRVATRSGDTSPAQRAAQTKRPPHLLVTTPESLYLLLTAEKSREKLRAVRTVIVDEIHAVARDKRGSHLAITLERLAALCPSPPQRIGLSATQRPIETLARLLVGAGADRSRPDGSPACEIVDEGHRRALDLAIEVPGSELAAVASHEQWGEILERIAKLASEHRTTLVFSNTRRLAERIAHQLGEKVGEGKVAAHHGSLSKERRARVEERLRAGDLSVLVATASLELGIDIGPVELVCQLGSPRSIATLLQRVGRSGHARRATPKGRLFPTTRDELIECAALCRAVRAGRLDRVLPPQAPLDILAQQIVAACAAEEWREGELLALVRRAAPFAELADADYESVLEMLSEGIATGRGRRAAWLHRDRVNGLLRARRGARLAALTSGGAIPDTADYRVVADPDDTFVGTVNEDWAIESMAGDIFLLGTTSWQIRRVETGVVRVRDAEGKPPNIPFWLGEAPARTEELSGEVSQLRADVEVRLARDEVEGLPAWLTGEACLDLNGAEQVVRYLAAARESLGALPTRERIVVERFFDDTGGMQLVIHAPFGGRVNRALGLAVRKRICRSFDFELQASASDDAIALSLGPQQGAPLEAFTSMLAASNGAREALAQAVLLAPMWTARWRWNLGRALAVLRMRGGRKNPPQLQRMEADDLMAAIFPALAQCQENAQGPIELPDHPLVRQTLHDCLHEAMDVDALLALMQSVESGAVAVHACDTIEPSPLAHEILNGRPYTFLDDAPLEERRTRAVNVRRGLPVAPRDLRLLDADAIARVRDEARPDPRDADELCGVLQDLVLVPPCEAWRPWFDDLVHAGRATTIESPQGPLWLAAERLGAARALFPDARVVPELALPDSLRRLPVPDEDTALALALRGHLDALGPTTAAELATRSGLDATRVERGLARLEGEGFALHGRFDPRAAADAREVCARRLLARVHAYTRERLRSETRPVSAQDYLRFLLAWQQVLPESRREGRRGVLAAAEQLQGLELAAGGWEGAVLPARVAEYRREWLDALCLSGELCWGRLALRDPAGANGDSARRVQPSRATPISLVRRDDLPWLLAALRADARPEEPTEGAAADVWGALGARGALFEGELTALCSRTQVEIEEALWELVGRGLVTADGFEPLRLLLGTRKLAGARASASARARLRRRLARAGGRWAPLGAPDATLDRDELAEAVAEQLLARWGVVFFDVLARESLALPWREILWALRRLEARGLVRGGRFVTGFAGEQYALPGAVEALARTRRAPRRGESVRLSAVDPLNLAGILTPGPRIPAVASRWIVFRDGIPEEEGAPSASAHAS
ncbi:MAG TPA: DEAD/DEAH box helicase [Myxococcota bacterium]|nr:DEAD/DEAH box helicase [Myxococcota bacterium]